MSRLETRLEIIKDCAALFNQSGYMAIGVPEIEKITGKTKAVLYGYFDNRLSLARAVLDYNLSCKRLYINGYVNERPTFIKKLLAHIQIYNPQTAPLPDGQTIWIKTDYSQNEMREVTDKALLLWKQDLIELIKAGIKMKEFSTDRKPIDLAWLLISLIEGAVSVHNVTQNVAVTTNLLDNAAQVFQSYFTFVI